MSASSKPSSTKDIPVWKGALFGGLLAVGILGYVLGNRPKRQVPRPATSAVATPTPTASVAPPAPTPTERVIVQPVTHPAPTSSVGPTAEREAVDALHNGNIVRAAELYRALAAANPDNPAFVETARMLDELVKRHR